MVSPERNIGLSLSGGGYRAAAFHLGTLRKLYEMRILQRVSVISTISGGSIIGAYYCLNNDDFDAFYSTAYKKLRQRNIINNVLVSGAAFKLYLFVLAFLVPAIILLFTPWAWLFPVLLTFCLILLLKYQFVIFPVSSEIERLYDKYFYEKKSLGELPEHPRLVIGATNLQTARPFVFSKTWMQDSNYQYRKPPIQFKPSGFPISRAVMASSCVPFAFNPIKIDKEYFENSDDANKVHPLLVDGGVYDNQGIHRIATQGSFACEHVITSDAGGGATGELSFHNTIALLIATVDVFMARIKKAQMVQNIYDNAATTNRQIAYFSLAWTAKNSIPGFIDNLAKKQVPHSVIGAHKLEDEWVTNPRKFEKEITEWLETKVGYSQIIKPTPEELKIARSVGTNLTSMSKQQIDCLI